MTRSLTDPWTLGGIPIPNRVVLAPLAGIGNWFVRLQAKRHGAGLAVSEMVSSFAIHYENRRTLDELLRIHPDERAFPGPTSIQLFGQDPDVMRSAAAVVAARGADLIDLNMGCPVPKVMKTGAGAALLKDPDTAVAVARAAREGSGPARDGEAARRGRRARAPPRRGGRRGRHHLPPAQRQGPPQGHAGLRPGRAAGRGAAGAGDRLAAGCTAPTTSAGSSSTRGARRSCSPAAHSGTRGCSRSCWAPATARPPLDEVVAEWLWVVDRAAEHLGPERAASYLKKFHPWYVERARRRPRGSGRPAAGSHDRRAEEP